MFVSITSTREVLAGPDAEINCPACGEMNVPAHTRQQTERFYLYGLVLVQRVTATIVTCGACGLELKSKVGIDQIDQYTARDLDLYLARNVSFVVKFIALASLLLFWAPIVGLVLAVIGLVSSSDGWTRTVSWVSLFLSGLLTALFVALLAIGP
jgi:transcription elongation factor Elf1